MVTDATQAMLEQPGLFWRRKYAFEGDSYHPPIEPACPQDVATFRSASASATPPADSASDLTADRWALDFMQKHRDPSSSVYYPAMVLAAFVQGWPKAFQIDKLDLDPWAEFMLWPGRNLPADADAWVDDYPENENFFTITRQRLEALNAREPDTNTSSDAYVEAELKLYHLTGCWELGLTGGELFGLLLEVENLLIAYENTVGK